MMNKTVTFQTACWENDWIFLLKTPYLKAMITRCGIDFTKRQLLINNVNNRALVESYAKKSVKKGIIDEYYFVNDYAQKALDFFGLTRQDFVNKKTGIDGYYYSITNMVGTYLCHTDYLLRFTSDTILNAGAKSWAMKAIDILEENPSIAIANSAWNNHYDVVKKESFNEQMIGDFYVGYGFSDQCYLARVADLKGEIYNYTHPASERYPVYGGELFEKKMDAWMRCTERYRITSAKESYRHKNFPKNSGVGRFKRQLRYLKCKLEIYPR